jgi:hypothetical protein
MNLRSHLPLVEPPDSVWASIEARLEPARSRPLRRRPFALAAAALFLIAAAPALYWFNLHRAHWIETGPSSRATLPIANIGTVDLAPNTRLRIVTDRPDQHRLNLAHGVIHAKIDAPPRLFLVDTKSGTAIDLGCEYTLQMDERGSGVLHVTRGWVSFQRDALESVIPAGAMSRIHPQNGPGLPYFEDANPAFIQAIDQQAIDPLLANARLRDTLTLWHLLSRSAPSDRARIYDRIAALTPLPATISKERVLALDPQALTLLREELAWKW